MLDANLCQDVPGLDAGIDRALWKRIRMAATVCHGGVLLARVGSWGCLTTPRVRRLFHSVIHNFRLYLATHVPHAESNSLSVDFEHFNDDSDAECVLGCFVGRGE